MNNNTFYVLRLVRHVGYVANQDTQGAFDFYGHTSKTAHRFSTFVQAAQFIALAEGRYQDKFAFKIVRVNVAPGKSAVVITNRTKIDATKPCVIRCYSTGYFVGKDDGCVLTLDQTKVFPDLQEALTWMQQRKCVWSFSAKVFNVETQTTAESFTETVLA